MPRNMGGNGTSRFHLLPAGLFDRFFGFFHARTGPNVTTV